MVLEAIPDVERWIWGCSSGYPGILYDIEILDLSTKMKSILEGTILPSFEYKVNGRTRNQFYYLLDGIYPKWVICISTIAVANTKKDNHFSVAQEVLRKVVKIVFGVLLSRCHILFQTIYAYE